MDEGQWKEGFLYGEEKLPLKTVSLKAVPYSCWANRTQGEMLVWMNELRQ